MIFYFLDPVVGRVAMSRIKMTNEAIMAFSPISEFLTAALRAAFAKHNVEMAQNLFSKGQNNQMLK